MPKSICDSRLGGDSRTGWDSCLGCDSRSGGDSRTGGDGTTDSGSGGLAARSLSKYLGCKGSGAGPFSFVSAGLRPRRFDRSFVHLAILRL